MVGIKNFMWVFPIFGAVFGILIFVFPVMNWYLDAYYFMNWSYWIFGLAYYRYIGHDITDPRVFEINFTTNLNLLIVSFITMILISVAVIFLIIAGISNMRKSLYNKKFMTRTSIGTILLFAGGILFWVGAGWPTTPHSLPYPPVSSVWNLFNGGFSAYTPFIGGGIALLGIPLYYYILKTRVEKSAQGKETSLKTKGFKEKTGVKKYIWVVPTIGVIFGIITFLAPAISFSFTTYASMNWYYWIWGLTSYSLIDPDPYGPPDISEIAFTNNTQLLTFSIVSSIMILAGVIILLIQARASRKNMHYSKKFMIRTGISAVLLITGGILFWVGADWPTTQQTGPFPLGVSVWTYFNEGFSIYAPFIAGGISLLGITVHYIIFKFRIEASRKRGDISYKIDEFREKIDAVYDIEKEINDKIAKLEETQRKILIQISDLRKTDELENPPI